MGLAKKIVQLLLCIALLVSAQGASAKIDAETATHVGGDLTYLGKRLAALQEAGAQVLAAAPGTPHEVAAAFRRMLDAKDPEPSH